MDCLAWLVSDVDSLFRVQGSGGFRVYCGLAV